MAQAKRGPKAKPKDVEQVVESNVFKPVSPLSVQEMINNDKRQDRVWHLASDMLLQKAKLASALTPQAISEVARWAKQLDWELNG